MSKPKPNTFSKVRMCFSLCVLFIYANVHAINLQSQDSKQQDTIHNPSLAYLWGKSNALNNTRQYAELLVFVNKHIHKVEPKNKKDSLDLADLYFNQYQGNYYTGKYLESINSADKGILFCGKANSKRGNNIKGSLLYKRAYGESELGFGKRCMNSMKTAIDFLSVPDESNLDYLVDAYVFLSSQSAYYGNLADAKRYIRLATNTYQKHKKYLDKFRPNNKYDVVLAYRKAYLLYKLAKNKEDSLEIVKVVENLEKIHNSPSFQPGERIYYSTALNHIGDWYVSHEEDSLTSKEDIETGSYYIDKSIDLIENKGYVGNYFSFKYNKCKALAKANKLQEANDLIIHLIDSLSVNDGRRPFFLAQKGLVKAQLGQKDSALHIFHSVIENIHTDSIPLAKDYSNFKPSKVYGETGLIRRVAEKLEEFYKDDATVQKMIAKLYYLAFIQFENSYARNKFNPSQNILIRQIMYGILANTKDAELQDISLQELVSRTETMMNQMTWQRFYQNRYTNKLPALDSLKYRHLELRTLLTAAKKQHNVREEDSLLYLINQHESFTNNKFPNLELVSKKQFQLADLQSSLDDNELVIKYILFERKLAIFSITTTNISWELRPWTSKEIELVETYVSTLKSSQYDADIANKFGEILLPNIPENIQKIVINPDGELYKIPFETLQLNNQFLTQTYETRYTSNLKFIHLEDNIKQETTLAIYAPAYEGNTTALATRSGNTTLEGAKEEAKIIGKLFPSKVFIGKDVSKKYFLETAPDAGILHLAMHAEINNKEAGLSRLLFTKNKANDDDLYLEELYALNLSADLAVLSACNTGVGKENAGRGMESFQRAFTFAGVPATVASLWEVPDQSTSEIMESFYTYLQKGVSKTMALQKAKLDYIKKHKGTKLTQPYYWAGFVLYGDQTPVTGSSSTIIWYIFGVLFVILGIVIFRKRAKKPSQTLQ